MKAILSQIKKSALLLTLALMGFATTGWGAYSGTGTFTKITSLAELTDGYYVVAYGTTFAMSNTNAGSYFANAAIAPTGGTTLTNPAAAIVWKIETNGGGKTIYNEASDTYVSFTGSSNAAQAVASVSGDAQRWTFSYSANLFVVANLAATARQLQYNTGSPRFACYTGSQQSLTLYKLPSTTTPALTLSKTLVDFGSTTKVNTTATQTFTLTPANLSADLALAMKSGVGSIFSVDSVAIAQSTKVARTVTVTFAPTAAGDFKDTLVISGGGLARDTAIALAGTAWAVTPPTLALPTSSAVTATSALLSGVISNNGGETPSEYGFYYSTTDGFANGEGTQVQATNFASGEFSKDADGLTESTQYYFKAYAINSADTGFSDQATFTTVSASQPTLVAIPSEVAFDTIQGKQQVKQVTIEGANLTQNVTLSLQVGTAFSLSGVSSITAAQAMEVDGYDVAITYTAQSANATDTLLVTCADIVGVTRKVALSGTTRIPSLNAAGDSIKFGQQVLSASKIDSSIQVTAQYCTDSLTVNIAGVDAAMFSAKAKMAPNGGKLYVTYTPTLAGAHSATLKVAFGSIVDSVALSGTGAVAAPTATAATGVGASAFTANWSAVAGATEYELSVYTKTAVNIVTNPGFEVGNADDWTTGTAFSVASASPHTGSYYLSRTATTGTHNIEQVVTVEQGKTYVMSFWYNSYTASNTNGIKNYTIQGTSGSSYVEGGNPVKLSAASAWTKYEKEFTATGGNVKISIRTYEPCDIDDIFIVEKQGSAPAPITGSPFTATETSKSITGLTPATNYFYTVKAKAGSATSSASNEISVTLTALPTLIANPNATLNMGEVLRAEATTPQAITVTGTNVSDSIAYVITGANASDFSVAPAAGWNNKTGGSLNVVFTPSVIGARSATLTLSVTDATPIAIALSGTGLDPDAPALVVTQHKLTFETVKNRQQILNFRIQPSHLAADDITLGLKNGAASKFVLSAAAVPNNVDTLIRVTFNATESATDTIIISHSSIGSVKVALQGTANLQVLTVTPTTLTIAAVKGVAKTATFKVRGTLLEQAISITSNNSKFTVDSATLTAAGANAADKTVTVTFDASEAATAKIAVTTKDVLNGNITDTVRITGTVAIPTISSDSASLTFARVASGMPTTKLLRITYDNIGDSVTVSVTQGASMFSVNTSKFKSASYNLFVTYMPSALGANDAGQITLTTPGAVAAKVIPLSGKPDKIGLVQWDFAADVDSSRFGIAANVGRKIITNAGSPAAGTIGYANGVSSRTITAANWGVDKYWEIDVNTLGYQDVALSFSQSGSNTGPKDFKVQYSVNGAAFEDVQGGVVTLAAGVWSTVNRLALPKACNNKASVKVRWVCTSVNPISGTFGTSGTNRLDDIQLAGNVYVPVPYVNPKLLISNVQVGTVTATTVDTMTYTATLPAGSSLVQAVTFTVYPGATPSVNSGIMHDFDNDGDLEITVSYGEQDDITFVVRAEVAGTTAADKNEAGSIMLYPNPVDNALYIKSLQQVVKVGIYTTGGSLIMEQNATDYVDVSTLSGGSYIVKVMFVNGKSLSKVVTKR